MQPAIILTEEPTEYQILEAVRAKLAAAVGPGYIYDSADAYIVARPQVKHLAEIEDDGGWPKALYLISPGDTNPQDYTQCATLFPGDLLVTAAIRIGTPELPWTPGYVPAARYQLRLFHDVYKALHLKQHGDAIFRVLNRNLDLEVDGWAIVQIQLGFEFSEVDPS